MLTYRCEQDCLKPKVRMLVVYVCSEGSQVNEMHVVLLGRRYLVVQWCLEK